MDLKAILTYITDRLNQGASCATIGTIAAIGTSFTGGINAGKTGTGARVYNATNKVHLTLKSGSNEQLGLAATWPASLTSSENAQRFSEFLQMLERQSVRVLAIYNPKPSKGLYKFPVPQIVLPLDNAEGVDRAFVKENGPGGYLTPVERAVVLSHLKCYLESSQLL